VVVVLVAAPEVYDQVLRLPRAPSMVEIAFLTTLSAFIALVSVGIAGAGPSG
jgi:hypothetical protein